MAATTNRSSTSEYIERGQGNVLNKTWVVRDWIANAGQHQEQTDVLWPAPPCQDPSPQQKQGITGDVLSTRSLTVTTVPSDSDSAHHTDDEGSSGQSMVNQGDEIAITAMGVATAAVVANAARFVFDAVAEEPAALKLLEATVEGSALLTSEAEAAFASAGGAGYPAAGTEEVADDETKPDPPSSSSLAKTEVKGEVQNVTTAGHEPPENEADPMNGAPELPGTQTTAGRPGRLRLQARILLPRRGQRRRERHPQALGMLKIQHPSICCRHVP